MSLILLEKLPSERAKNGELRYYGLFLCSFCLNKSKKRLDVSRIQQSCGCVSIELQVQKTTKHGEGHGTRLYKIWDGIKQRCLNSSAKNYKDYGGRGIKVCIEWKVDFNIFKDWATQNGYRNDLQINRIDNDGNYEPNNCNWVTSQVNNQNQRSTKLNGIKVIEIRNLHKTGNYTLKKLAEDYSVSITTIHEIITNKHWRNF